MTEKTFSNYPIVSVIIPNYNHSIFLEHRIESVLNQSYTDFEIIILDDKSSDNSRLIIEKYRSNPKITQIVYNNINSGSTFLQWDKGIKLASGDYIWIAESDDVADINFLKEIIPILIDNPDISVAFTNSHLIDEHSNLLNSDWDLDDNSTNGYDIFSGNQFCQRKMLHHNRIYNASAVVFKKDKYFKISKEYLRYKASGDYIFWIEMIRNNSLLWIHKKLNFFRQHKNKVSPNASRSGLIYQEKFLQIPYLKNNIIFSYRQKADLLGRGLLELLMSNDVKKNVKLRLAYSWIIKYPLSIIYIFYSILIILFTKAKIRLAR